ncbi:MAG: TonB-dependent receptor [Ignavibacteria bacterium]|nr:TonB-dependent receptor [Ignavibacteria bacterium]
MPLLSHVSIAAILLCTALLAGTGNAQHRVGGTVKDKATGRGLEFVNVSVLQGPDSAVVTGAVTGRGGAFDIAGLSAGAYVCRFSLLGYRTAHSASFRVDAQHPAVALGVVALEEAPVTLDEVVVTTEKLLYNTAIDRKVYNVGQDIAAKTGSASDVLQNVPSVEVDVEGNVSLRGSSNVLILINGKNSPLMGQNRAEVLQQLPASALERIEVITNPSAKYKPDGSSGIINLVLKKNTDLGFNGSLGANAGNQDRYNATLRMNYKPDGINLFGSYAVRQDSRNRISSDVREEPATGTVPGSYRWDSESSARPLAHIAMLGAEAELGAGTSAGVTGDLFRNAFVRSDRSIKTYRNMSGLLTAQSRRDLRDSEWSNEAGFTAFAEHAFDGEEHTLRAEFSASRESEEEDNRASTSYDTPFGPPAYDNALLYQVDAQQRASLDYGVPLSETSKLEAGYSGDFTSNESEYTVEDFDPDQQTFVRDATKSYVFHFRDAQHAVYATFEQSLGLFGFMAGLRAEQTLAESKLVSRDSSIENSYFSLYPTVHLAYTLGEETELQLNYSRRTNRPDGGDLNPFPEYRDPKNVSAGNAKLLPEYINSVEVGAKAQWGMFSIVPSLYYRHTYNRFTWVTTVLPDSTFFSTMQNLEKDQSAGLEVIFSASANDVFKAHASGNLFYNQIDASNLGYGADKSIVSWRGAATCSVRPFEGTMLQLNANFHSARLTPQGETSPSYTVNLGARQELFDGRLTLVLTAGDIFKSMKRETRIDTPELQQTVINRRDSRVLFFGMTWTFGSQPKKKDDTLKYDEAL